jgi:DNA-binding IclR family transcriptional regulator
VTKPLSDQQLKCLAVINDVWPEAITPAGLATRLDVPTNTAIAYVAILVNRGYVTRSAQQRGISYLSAKSATTS